MNVINITSNGIKQAIDNLVNENEMLQDKVYKLENIINELEEYIKPFLYMLNGITDRDIYEECQLEDFTMIMEKLQELKGSDKDWI